MLAVLGELPGHDAGWGYEFKWDGVRIIAYVHSGQVRLMSRTDRDVTGSYPELAGLSDLLDGVPAVLDGEVVAYDDRGRPSSLPLPYRERRDLLAELALDGPHVRTPPWFAGGGADVLAASAEQGLEGVVAKRLESPYLPGRRSPAWRKVKPVRTQEVVIGGWKPGEGRRAGMIGSLLLGIPGPEGLRYVGHVGTGFTQAML